MVLSYVFRLDSKETPVYKGTTVACFHIIEEQQQAAQTSDSREMATSSTDRMAQTPPILLFTWMHARGYILQSAHTGALVLFLQCSIYNGHWLHVQRGYLHLNVCPSYIILWGLPTTIYRRWLCFAVSLSYISKYNCLIIYHVSLSLVWFWLFCSLIYS